MPPTCMGFLTSPRQATILSGWVRDNVALIKSLPSTTFGEIEGVVLRGWRDGKRADVIAEEIRQRFGVARSRAELIASDQVGKLNGQLTRDRLLAVGVKRARWRTSEDGRVRPSHQSVKNRIFDLDEGIPGLGFPGQPIRCRCHAVHRHVPSHPHGRCHAHVPF